MRARNLPKKVTIFNIVRNGYGLFFFNRSFYFSNFDLHLTYNYYSYDKIYKWGLENHGKTKFQRVVKCILGKINKVGKICIELENSFFHG